jgi:hypothetical protein
MVLGLEVVTAVTMRTPLLTEMTQYSPVKWELAHFHNQVHYRRFKRCFETIGIAGF